MKIQLLFVPCSCWLLVVCVVLVLAPNRVLIDGCYGRLSSFSCQVIITLLRIGKCVVHVIGSVTTPFVFV